MRSFAQTCSFAVNVSLIALPLLPFAACSPAVPTAARVGPPPLASATAPAASREAGAPPLGASRAVVAPPSAPRRPVVDVHHGTSVRDDYRWLETWADPEVQTWTEAQNRHTDQFLGPSPARDALRSRVAHLVDGASPIFFGVTMRGKAAFAFRRDPKRQQTALVRLRTFDDAAAFGTVVDPEARDPSGRTAIDWFVPSPDGRHVAVSLSKDGSEDGTLYVFDGATGAPLADVLPRVQYPTGGGSLAWSADGKGFYYTRYPQPGERPAAEMHFHQRVFFHALGAPPASDAYSFGEGLPAIAEIDLTADDAGHVLARVSNGDGGEHAFYLQSRAPGDAPASPRGWTKIADYSDRILRAALGRDGAVYFLSVKRAPRGRILRAAIARPSVGAAREIVPESDAAIRDFVVAKGRLYTHELVGGPSQIRVFEPTGSAIGRVPLPEVSSASALVALDDGGVLFESESYTQPPAWYRFDASSGRTAKTALAMTSPASFDDLEVLRETAVSKDGTRVPMSIVRRKGTRLDGANPTLISGYGGYGISTSPGFSAPLRTWFDRGGVYIDTNTRGGGEFGEAWHEAGMLTKKQNVFDDFIACAERAIELGYTTPKLLAAYGASNGGLLMGAALTQRPDLFAAVVVRVAPLDAVRSETGPNGQFNTTEFGTVKDPDQFRALLAYSPYHNVKDGTAYPAVLLSVGANDGRVDGSSSRKMAARLQAATTSGRPVLLRTWMFSGHGMGSPTAERIERATELYGFLFTALGIEY